MRRAVAVPCLALALGSSIACATSKPLWRQPLPPPLDAPVVDASKLQRRTFANGARVLLLEDARLPTFSIGVVVPRGAGVEAIAQAGLATYMAALMERGAGERDALELAAAVDALGATLQVTAGWDSVGVHISGLSRDFDALFEILSDVALRPRFAAKEARRVRAEQRAALLRARDDPNTLTRWSFFETLYPEHRYGYPISGAISAVEKFNAAAARKLYKALFTPQQAILYGVGDLDAAALRARFEKIFGTLEGAPPLPAVAAPPAAPQPPRFVLVDRPDLGQAMVALGHEGIAQGADPRLELWMMNAILGRSGFSSRLVSRLRAEEGLSYSVRSTLVQRRAGGALMLQSFTEAGRIEKLLRGMLEEFEGMRSRPPGADELRRAQTFGSGSFSLALETSVAVARALVNLEVYDLPRDSLDTYRGRVRALSPEAVAQAAARAIHPERASIVVVGPAEVIAKQLETFGAFEVIRR